MNCSDSLSTAAKYQISHNQLLEAGKSGQSCRMCLKNDSNLWFKIDTIESVVFLFYNYVLARSIRDTMSGTV